jgi:hypothetical protein
VLSLEGTVGFTGEIESRIESRAALTAMYASLSPGNGSVPAVAESCTAAAQAEGARTDEAGVRGHRDGPLHVDNKHKVVVSSHDSGMKNARNAIKQDHCQAWRLPPSGSSTSSLLPMPSMHLLN